MRRLTMFLALALVLLVPGPPGHAQSSDDPKALRQEIEALKEGQRTLEKELGEIRRLLTAPRPAAPAAAAAPAAPTDAVLSIEGSPFKGDRNAKVVLIEFSDYQCPFCARYARETLPQIEREHISTGKVKYVFRDFPIESIHKDAVRAAAAAHCAGDQGKYWEMHDRLFANQRALGASQLPLHAESLGLDLTGFSQCLESRKHDARVRKDLAEGQRAGVRGTPGFFLGLAGPDDSKVKALRTLRGAQPFAAFKEAIEGLLSSQR